MKKLITCVLVLAFVAAMTSNSEAACRKRARRAAKAAGAFVLRPVKRLAHGACSAAERTRERSGASCANCK